MSPLTHLAVIRGAGFVAAKSTTRLTPVLYFVFVCSVYANVGVLPSVSGAFIRDFAELGHMFIMFALGALSWS